MKLINIDEWEGFIYDVIIKQFDTAFWKQTTGTTTVSSNKLRNNAAALASYMQLIYADIEFMINMPAAPTAGDARHWGLRSPATDALGAAYFKIAGAVFTAETTDEFGNTKSTTLTWSAGYTTTDTKFRIRVGKEEVTFYINDVVVATHTSAVPHIALPIRISNTNADNMDMAYLDVRRAAAII